MDRCCNGAEMQQTHNHVHISVPSWPGDISLFFAPCCSFIHVHSGLILFLFLLAWARPLNQQASCSEPAQNMHFWLCLQNMGCFWHCVHHGGHWCAVLYLVFRRLSENPRLVWAARQCKSACSFTFVFKFTVAVIHSMTRQVWTVIEMTRQMRPASEYVPVLPASQIKSSKTVVQS